MKQAAAQLGISPMTVTRWCQTGKLSATSKPFGGKTTYQIPAMSVAFFQRHQQEVQVHRETIDRKPHPHYLKAWKAAMAKGLLNGRVFSAYTIETYSHYVDSFMLQFQEVSSATLQAALMRVPPVNFAKRLKLYESVVCLGKFLLMEGVLEPERIEKMKTLRPQRHIPPKRLTVDADGLPKLLDACQTPLERLIVLLLSHTGLRAFEACALRLQHIELEKATLTVACGKGGKRRSVGLTPALMQSIHEHLGGSAYRPDSFLLVNRDGGQMDRHGLRQRVERIGKRAGVTASPHALRRAFVTINANKGRPLQMLQRACGHSDIKTTMSYCRTSEQEVIEAMQGWD